MDILRAQDIPSVYRGRCTSHVLNLIAQAGIHHVEEPVDKIRQVAILAGRSKGFERFAELQLEIDPLRNTVRIPLDVST